jgi:isoleucyl-tRNA synthetase
MSKSLGNSIEPAAVINASGADILRLWVAMSDFTQEIRISQEILARAVDVYRKIRNTMRYLLGNLYDFDPMADRLPADRLEEIDRYILGRYAELAQRIIKAYADYDYATVFQGLNTFTNVDLSAFYADVSKDRLYTYGVRSSQRRSAQTAMYTMADGLTRLMAPIMPFTADELWRHLPRQAVSPSGREESVHLALFPRETELAVFVDRDLLERWTRLLAVREEVLAEIEPLRKGKQIGSSLQARVVLTATAAELPLLERYAKELPMLFIVSDVEVRPAPDAGEAPEAARPRIAIERAGGMKCERCWRYVDRVSSEAAWAGLCARCQDALAQTAHA